MQGRRGPQNIGVSCMGFKPPKGGENVERIKELVLACVALLQALAELLQRLAELIRLFKTYFSR
jgi:hypothetical protein